MAVITVSRQAASGGDEVARALAQRLGYRLVGKELLTRVATMAHVPVEQVEAFEATSDSVVERFLHAVARSLPDLDDYYRAFVDVPDEQAESMRRFVYYGHKEGHGHFGSLRRDDCLRFFESAVRDLAERGNIVLVGRGAQVLLADFPHALHVRVTAPLALRVARLSRDEQLGPDGARERIDTLDGHRRDYLRVNYDRDIDDLAIYDLAVSLDKLNVDDVVETVHRWVVSDRARHESQLGGDSR